MIGQAVCTTVMCADGRRKVAEMWNAFNYLSESYSGFDSSRFLPACNTIQQSLDAIDSWYATWIPFNPVCCSIDDIGNQAVQLTNDMLSSVGAAGVPVPPASTDWGSVIVIAGIVILAAIYSPQIKKAIS
jgi:hypothetical protein